VKILLYLLLIITANVVTASFPPLVVGLLIIPYGTLFVGFTFVMRDFVQDEIGKKKTYVVIALALLLSAVTSFFLGDTMMIVLASTISFFISEATDTEIYSNLKKSKAVRVLTSGVVGGTLDSVIFVVIGLSPLGAGFLPWGLVIYACLGQVAVKSIIQIIVYYIMKKKIV
jgi:queuosine precursor transporter